MNFSRRNGRKISPLLWLALVLVLFAIGALAGYMTTPASNLPTGPRLRLTFLSSDLGGGVLLRYSDNKLVLVDPGPKSCADDLVSYLGKIGAKNLTLIISEADRSAYGAMDSLVDTFSVSQVVYPDGVKGDKWWKSSLGRIQERGIKSYPVSDGDSVVFASNSTLQILAPLKDAKKKDSIDKLIGRLVYGDISILLASRLTPQEEVVLVESAHVLSSSILHVSCTAYNSTTLEFLSRVRPEYCIVPSGAGRCRPSAAMLSRIDPLNTGAELLQSTKRSSVLIQTDGNTVRMID